jgi:hypothetical protein
VLETGPVVQLQPAARQPVAQQRRPSDEGLLAIALERHCRVAAAGQRGDERCTRWHIVIADLDTGVVAATSRLGDAGVVVADAVARAVVQAVGCHPRRHLALPEARDGLAVGADVAHVGHALRLSVDQFHVHGGGLQAAVAATVPIAVAPGLIKLA